MGTACNSREFLASEPAGVVPRTLMVLFSYIGLASQTYDVTLKVWEQSKVDVWNPATCPSG